MVTLTKTGRDVFSGYDISNNAIAVENADASTWATEIELALGAQAIVDASKNTGGGYQVLNSITTGANNAGFGYQTLYSLTTGSSSSGFGYQSLYSATTGGINSGFGYQSLFSVTTGAFNSGFGYTAGSITTTGNFNCSLGYNAQPSSASASGEFTMGDTNITSLRCNVTSITALSDARDKANVVENSFGLDFLLKVHSVQFDYATREGNANDGKTRLGFIAQELLELGHNDITDLVHTENPDRLEARYGNLIPILVKSVQELSARVDYLTEELDRKNISSGV